MPAAPLSPERRKKVLRVIFISLLLDLISFTFILPLYPKLLEFYRNLEAPNQSADSLLNRILLGLNTYKRSFSRPISDRYDVVLLGGALGSLFSFLQAIASPVIGTFSDKYGRRTALLWSMAGNIASVALWVAATDFRTFLASRVVGGLSEGNVQLAIAMAADVSDDKQRGATMALVGVCFSIAFTFGPALGAALANVTTVAANPFATAAGFSLFLILVETLYLYLYLPETLPSSRETATATANGSATKAGTHVRTNSHLLLNMTHFVFILFFSGMEFSFPFMTYDLFAYTSRQSGTLLGFIGLIAAILQGFVTRRLHPLRVVQLGVVACAVSFFMLGRLQSERGLYAAATLLAVTTATVVTGLNSLSSFEAGEGERGEKLGNHRSWGQFGRALGPLVFCSLYWWAGRDVAYGIGGVGMLGVCAVVFGALKAPPSSLESRVKG
ncbi:MAG: MFS general substrate transporter [Lasallia pustulata]|uniref:MFS general substrate transporter n=1 Tax=Lasallia pustulata TaxID=136370 RepID=A0A1W5CU06_9LECA|nr:MAG: MFS general substrate transporter [Lasallia pustulata]SLM34336.1 major facilitator superfamily transporter protein [Lasallia pustulata]